MSRPAIRQMSSQSRRERLRVTRVCARVGASIRTRVARSYEAACKTARIFDDYVLDLYYPVQEMSRAERIRCAPLLLLVEYMVYTVDSITERSKEVDLAVAKTEAYHTLHRYKAKFETFLRRVHAYNWSVSRELEMGEQYVRLENKVTSKGRADHAEVMRLAELRPSDVRLLHSMIFALRKLPCDRELLDLLWPVEVLADIGNDLAHYHEDVAFGRFNTYSAFVNLYGADAPAMIRDEIARYERLFHTQLATFPPASQTRLRTLCYRRYREQTTVIPEILPQSGSTTGRQTVP